MPSQRIKEAVAAGKARQQEERAKGQHGGARKGAGAKKGVRLTTATRERIRGAMLIDRLTKIAEGKAPNAEPHHVTAALGLLQFQLPKLAATDVTSGGEPITVERVEFKRSGSK